MNTILVSSHRRSGTHFLIDALRKNIYGAEFPNHRHLPADLNIGSLYAKDEKVYSTFKKLIKSHETVIIKSHLLPEESYLPEPRDKHEELISTLFNESKKIYISRDVTDVMISLHKYLRSQKTLSEFIREPNDHIVKEIRKTQPYDANRIRYWDYHINSWKQTESTKSITFVELMRDFEFTMKQILSDFGYPLPDMLGKPMIPNNLLWHHIQKKLNHFGLAPLPECSSVRPNKWSSSEKLTFSEEDDIFVRDNSRVE